MLPGPYERWFHELCGRPSPVESRSTCDDCAMLLGAPGLPPEGPFDPAVLCCTYHPHLAPHLVGEILESGTEQGRALLRARIEGRVGVTPLGLGPTPLFAKTLQRLAGNFGRSVEIRCPFHDAGRCTIWRQRGPACAAFHCKYDRGALGAGAWNVLLLFFTHVERALAHWLIARQGLEAGACDALLHSPADAALDARAWGAWRGREEEYFVEAARSIEPLSWRQVLEIGGRQLAALSDSLPAALARFDEPPLPLRVRRGDAVLHRLGLPGRTLLQNPALPLDPLEVPALLADRLAQLKETPLADLHLDGDLVRRLLDWQVLVPG